MFFSAEEKLVAGGASDTLNVRHLKLKGSNREIGREIARIATERHRFKPTKASDKLLTRVRRDYVAKNYPPMYERMKGVADHLKVDLEGDYDLFGIGYNLDLSIGCSTVFYPPSYSQNGHGILSRNYDFTTSSFAELVGAPKPTGARSMTGDPYVIEMYPDRGYPSLYVCAYDLLVGCIDGINSEGLTVALLADDESNGKYQMEPTGANQVGFGEIEITRFLLDTCSCVEDAKQALLSAKQYYSFIPCHYIIADRHGKSFVWEYSYAHNKEHIIDGSDKPQVVTNHPLHRYLTAALPDDQHQLGTYNRYKSLSSKASGKLSLEQIVENNCTVAVNDKQQGTPHRTLWHSVYDTEDRSASIDFYLAEDEKGKNGQKRSGYLKFKLDR